MYETKISCVIDSIHIRINTIHFLNIRKCIFKRGFFSPISIVFVHRAYYSANTYSSEMVKQEKTTLIFKQIPLPDVVKRR